METCHSYGLRWVAKEILENDRCQGASELHRSRKALDGRWYTYAEFTEYYGLQADRCWDMAEQAIDPSASPLPILSECGLRNSQMARVAANFAALLRL